MFASILAGIVRFAGIAKLQYFGDWIISTPWFCGQWELSGDLDGARLDVTMSNCQIFRVLLGDLFEGAISIC